MKKIFEFNIDNTIDIITNSSSELFVLQGRTKELVESMIRNVYPNFESEYRLVKLEECDEDDMEKYIGSAFDDNNYYDPLSLCRKINVRPTILYKNFGSYVITSYWRGELSEKGKKLLFEKFPKNTYLLFSLDENPNWDMQEQLMNIASRYHLG